MSEKAKIPRAHENVVLVDPYLHVALCWRIHRSFHHVDFTDLRIDVHHTDRHRTRDHHDCEGSVGT